MAANLGIEDKADVKYRLHDVLNDEIYVYPGAQLGQELIVGLDQFKSHVFVVNEEEQASGK